MGSSTEPLLGNTNHHFNPEDGDGKAPVGTLVKEFGIESKKLWRIAGPAILTSVFQYSLGAITQTFAGRIGELDLAAVSIENSVVAGLAFGVMVCMPPLQQCSASFFFFFFSILLCLHLLFTLFWTILCFYFILFFYCFFSPK